MSGAAMAAITSIDVTMREIGGRGARPQEDKDPGVTAMTSVAMDLLRQ
jgi:hypothetical protein